MSKLHYRLASAIVVAGLALSACSGAAKPTEVKITAPTPGTSINVGQGTVIQGEAVGESIIRVEVVIDGQAYATLNTPDNQGVANFPVQVPWTPTAAGSHAIQLKAFGNEDALLAQSDPLVVEAKAAVVPTQAVPTATQPPPPTQAPAPDGQATATPSGGGQQPVATQAPPQQEGPSLTVTNDFVNVREGPNTAYRLLGRLNQNETAPVRGKSQDGEWWQITYAGGTGGIGWVFGEYVQANTAAGGVPVASAPPLPTSPPAPPAPVPVPATAAPPTAPPAIVPTVAPAATNGPLSVNTTVVPSGGTVRASWNVPNINGAWFDKGDGSGYQPASGAMTVDVTGITGNRTIRLKIQDKNNVTSEYALNITVAGNPVATTSTTWAPKFKAGTSDPNANDTCTSAGVGGSCTYYWLNMVGASGIWLRVDRHSVGPCANTGNLGNIEPAGLQNGQEMPVTGPSGSMSIRFPSAGGYKIAIRVAKDNNSSAYYDEKPMSVGSSSDCGGGSNPTATTAPATNVPPTTSPATPIP